MRRLSTDYLVLGAGAAGTAAAYHLARRGERVTLVEQFAIGHDRGSSHGPSRIIRYSYADPAYARLMPAAFTAWRDLEADAGEAVYVRTGGVSLCRPHLDYVARVAGALAGLGVPHRRMTGADLRRSAPTFRVADDEDVVAEPDIGILAAGRIVRLQAELAVRHGRGRAELIEGLRARRLDLDGDRPAVIADGLAIEARRLVVAAGPWTARLLPGLGVPLAVTRQVVAHLRPADPGPYAVGRFPVFIRKLEADHEALYGLPDYAGAGVKVALHHVGPPADPDSPGGGVDPAEPARIAAALAEVLPELAAAPVDSAGACLYTVAPGEDFLVGPLPGRPDVAVATACSGHGFKFANLVGRILADYAQRGGTDLDVAGWLPPAGSVGGPPADP